METKENQMKKLHWIIAQYASAKCTHELDSLGLYCNSKSRIKIADFNLDLLSDAVLEQLFERLHAGERDGWTKTLREQVVKARFAKTIARYKNYGKKSEEEIKREEEEKMREMEEVARQAQEFESARKRWREEEAVNVIEADESQLAGSKKKSRKASKKAA